MKPITAIIKGTTLLQAGLLAGFAEAQTPNAGIHADSSVFVEWAVSCDLQRGPGYLPFPDSVAVSHGIPANATGKADKQVVSLGDGGSATLSFLNPVSDGPGYDFAVFENSFDGNFLELAFVEVSSDGSGFVRFPAVSLTQTKNQVGGFETLDPDSIVNLAGQHPALWGTAFDLSDLSDSAGLNLQSILYIRITDVVGILNDSLGTKDSAGNLINDPFPTPFESGGFDLDAIGVIHHSISNNTEMETIDLLKIYPNPCSGVLNIEDPGRSFRSWVFFNLDGRVLKNGKLEDTKKIIDMEDIAPGTYFIRIEGEKETKLRRILKID